MWKQLLWYLRMGEEHDNPMRATQSPLADAQGAVVGLPDDLESSFLPGRPLPLDLDTLDSRM